MEMLALIGLLLIGVTNIILMIYTLPQILLNYQLKSGTGISDAMLLGNLNMAFAGLVFVYAVDMPIIYRVMSPLALMAIVILNMQRIWYDGPNVKRFIFLFLANAIGLCIFAAAAYAYPLYVGMAAGWVSFAFQFIYQLPQIFKIVRSGSTHGFSFSSLSLQTLGYACELIAALILQLPWVVLANDIRAIVMYVIFALLFLKYLDRNDNKFTMQV